MVRLRFAAAAAGPEAARATRRRLLPPPTRAHAPLYAETIYLSLTKSAIYGTLINMLPHFRVENVGEFLVNLTFEVQNQIFIAKIVLFLECTRNVKKNRVFITVYIFNKKKHSV